MDQLQPQDIPLMICGVLCLIPLLVGMTGFFIPFMLAKRLPFIQISKRFKDGRKITEAEISLISRGEIKARKVKDKKV